MKRRPERGHPPGLFMEQEAKAAAARLEAFTAHAAKPVADLFRALKAQGLDPVDALELTKVVVAEIVKK